MPAVRGCTELSKTLALRTYICKGVCICRLHAILHERFFHFSNTRIISLPFTSLRAIWKANSGDRPAAAPAPGPGGDRRAGARAGRSLTPADESGVHRSMSARGRRRPPGRADGEGGGVVAQAGARERVTVAGREERARAVRGFVGAVLGAGHPCGDDAVLLAGELFGNSVRHSASGLPGQTVTVAVTAADGVIRVEVTDCSGPGRPQLRPAGPDAEGGRGLGLVEALSDRWGWRRRGGRTVTWFELRLG